MKSHIKSEKKELEKEMESRLDSVHHDFHVVASYLRYLSRRTQTLRLNLLKAKVARTHLQSSVIQEINTSY